MMKNNIYIYILMLFCFGIGFSQKQYPNDLLDSLYEITAEKPNYVLATIDSIEKNFKGKVPFDKDLYYRIKGEAYFTLMNYEKVYENFAKGIKYAKENNNLKDEGDYYLILSDVFNSLGNWEKSDEYTALAIEKYTKIDYTEGVLEAKQNHAIKYNSQGLFEKSNAILLKEELLYKNLKDPTIYILGSYYTFSNYLHLNNRKKAEEYLLKLKAIKKTFNVTKVEETYNYYLNNTNFELAEYFNNLKQSDSTIYYLEKFNKTIFDDDIQAKQFYYEISMDVYSRLNKNKLYEKYRDSLSQFKSQVKSSQFRLNTIKIDDILQDEERIDIKKKADNFFNTFSYTVLLTLIGLMLFIIYKRKKYRQKKGVKLEKTVIQLQGKEKILNEIKQELNTILKSKETNIRQKKITSLYNNLKLQSNALNFTSSYEELTYLNPLFFRNLLNVYPNLIESEQIICYYVFLNFKDIEISSLLKVSIRSVESKRYRIRKKMAINNVNSTLLQAIRQTQIKK